MWAWLQVRVHPHTDTKNHSKARTKRESRCTRTHTSQNFYLDNLTLYVRLSVWMPPTLKTVVVHLFLLIGQPSNRRAYVWPIICCQGECAMQCLPVQTTEWMRARQWCGEDDDCFNCCASTTYNIIFKLRSNWMKRVAMMRMINIIITWICVGSRWN